MGKLDLEKSASGNTILGSEVFVSKPSGSSITQGCDYGTVERFHQILVVVDTPGIFYTCTSRTTDMIQMEICKCIGITSPGPHAFIMVVSLASRFTDEEQRSIEHFEKHFGKKKLQILYRSIHPIRRFKETQNYTESTPRTCYSTINTVYTKMRGKGVCI